PGSRPAGLMDRAVSTMPYHFPSALTRSKQGPFAPGALFCAPILTTTAPSDSRWAPPDFAIGLYERSLLTRLPRRASLVPRPDLARVQLPVPRRDPPRPIRIKDWRTWPSP